MAILTGHRNPAGRGHLSLVPSHGSTGTGSTRVRSVSDPVEGPRDAAELVSRFSALLPADDAYSGLFSHSSI